MNNALTLEDKIKEFTDEYARRSDRLPCGFALYDSGPDREQSVELMGFCRLKSLNLKKYPEFTPWISSLLVLKPHKGYGRHIVEAACNILKGMGYREVYVYTDQAPDFYRKLGFEYKSEVDKNDGGRAELFKKAL